MGETTDADSIDFVVVEAAKTAWQPSADPGVWREPLGHAGPAELGRLTSLVRYDAGARFPFHEHPGGEEIFVIEGTLCDEHGEYPAGTYLLNPELPGHAPYSTDGCILFVKQHQYAGDARVVIDTNGADVRWRSVEDPGIARVTIFEQAGLPGRTQLERWEPGARGVAHTHPESVELFVLDGTFEDENGRYPANTWIRAPVGSGHAPFSTDGCKLFAKVGAELRAES